MRIFFIYAYTINWQPYLKFKGPISAPMFPEEEVKSPYLLQVWWALEMTYFHGNMSHYSSWKSLCHAFTSLSCSQGEKSSLPIFHKCDEPWQTISLIDKHTIQTCKFINFLHRVLYIFFHTLYRPTVLTNTLYINNNIATCILCFSLL